MPLLEALQQRARRLKTETLALCLAARHPGTPWYAKLFVVGIVAYAFSPIDVIPDFVPILGYLDDLVLLPLGIALAIKMVPPTVWAECRARAQAGMAHGKLAGRVAGAVIVMLWVALAALALLWAYRAWMSVPAVPTPAVARDVRQESARPERMIRTVTGRRESFSVHIGADSWTKYARVLAENTSSHGERRQVRRAPQPDDWTVMRVPAAAGSPLAECIWI